MNYLEKSSSFNTIYAMAIIFLTASVSILTSVYSTTLFLSTYPRSWLVIFLCLQAVSITATSFILAPMLSRQNKYILQFILAGFAVVFFLIVHSQPLHGYWTPLFISVATGTIGTLITLIAWNIIPLAFGMRKYKDVARYANQAAATGVIVGSLVIPLLLRFYSLSSLLMLCVYGIMACIVCIYMLTIVQIVTVSGKVKAKKTHAQWVLYKEIVAYTLLIIASQSLIDYIFKFELSKHFSNNQLGAFQGYYLGVTNVLALIIGIMSTRFLLKRIRIDGLLYITQALTLLACISAIVFPSLWTISILASIRVIFYFNYASLAIEIILNFFPSATRLDINLKIRTMITPLFVIFVYLILLVVSHKINEVNLLLVITALTIISFYSIHQISSAYKAILQQESDFKRFNLIEENYILLSNTESINDGHQRVHANVENLRSIPYLLSSIHENKNPTHYIKLLAAYPGEESEKAILELMNHNDVWKKTIVAKESRYRACQLKVGHDFKNQASKFAVDEAQLIFCLDNMLTQQVDSFKYAEVESRIQMATQRALCWLAVATDPVKISQIMPSLLKPVTSNLYQQAREKALELLELYINDRNLKNKMVSIFDPSYATKELTDESLIFNDDWLARILSLNDKGTVMESIEKTLDLRQVALFKSLPSEILTAIADEAHHLNFTKGSIIFKEDDLADGLYCICSGTVSIERQGRQLNTLTPYHYFGELSLIDDTPRAATAIALTDCSLLFLDKSTFDRITDDLPEVLRVVTKVIVGYLRKNLDTTVSG